LEGETERDSSEVFEHADWLEFAEPVERIPTDPERDQDLKGVALCLSGGGYRAMLFHAGAVWRLYETGWLGKVDRISSVSGGSIVAGILAMNWESLSVKAPQRDLLLSHFITPLRKLAGETLDFDASLAGALMPGTAGNKLANAYARHIFGEVTLQDMPDQPRFIFNATNVQSGVIWRFSKPYNWDWRVGKVPHPNTPLAVAVAASSAFPPILSPLILRYENDDFEENTGEDLQEPPYTTRVLLTDGGVYDNLGLETAWKRHKTILVSDGGGQMEAEPKPSARLVGHTYRIFKVIDNQVRSLRKRQLITSYENRVREGTYWGIRTNIENYELDEHLPCPEDATLALANIPTRLRKLKAMHQKRLINWGYAVTDAAMRRYVDPSLDCAETFPFPKANV